MSSTNRFTNYQYIKCSGIISYFGRNKGFISGESHSLKQSTTKKLDKYICCVWIRNWEHTHTEKGASFAKCHANSIRANRKKTKTFPYVRPTTQGLCSLPHHQMKFKGTNTKRLPTDRTYTHKTHTKYFCIYVYHRVFS